MKPRASSLEELVHRSRLTLQDILVRAGLPSFPEPVDRNEGELLRLGLTQAKVRVGWLFNQFGAAGVAGWTQSRSGAERNPTR